MTVGPGATAVSVLAGRRAPMTPPAVPLRGATMAYEMYLMFSGIGIYATGSTPTGHR